MTLAKFIATHTIGFKAEKVSFRPGANHFFKGSRHWLVRITYECQEFVTFFSQGSAIKDGPILASVLECLQSDCSIGEQTWNEYRCDFGDGTDRDTWVACRETRDNMLDLLGRRTFNRFMGIEFD